MDSLGQYLNVALAVDGLRGQTTKTHALDKSAEGPSCWHKQNTLETDTTIAPLEVFLGSS